MSAGTTLGRPVRAAREHQEPTPARNALRGGGLLVLGALLLFLVALSTWIGAKDTSLGQVWSAIWNDDGPAPPSSCTSSAPPGGPGPRPYVSPWPGPP
ncbi:hypothetical protein ACIPMU_24860 [Streptomyces cyaneofuscatus]|uniref:hypothetical protein n=1 Tax=Streptomyces cyaneofuscatus TaxID=66883 RepID=UPI003811CF31